MAFEPVRIIHACHLRLDHQLEGLTHLPNELFRVVEDATLTAFDYLLAACIDHQVDFLLLTGNTFDWQDGSLRAWGALEQGFELLAEHDIHVFVVPGETDPASAWLSGPRWPDNVTILYAEDGEPVAAMRDDKPVATIRLLDSHGKERDGLKLPRGAISPSGPLRLAPFTIGVLPANSSYMPEEANEQERENAPPHAVDHTTDSHSRDDEQNDPFGEHDDDDDDNRYRSPMDDFADADEAIAEAQSRHGSFSHDTHGDVIDYIALGGPPMRQTFVTEEGLAHHPGTTQGMNERETGSCGVTLVELDRQGKGRSAFIPTSVVRWEHARVALSCDATVDELQAAIRETVLNLTPATTEKICVIRWSIPGNGQLEQQIGTSARLQEMIERIVSAPPQSHSLRFLHLAEWSSNGLNHSPDSPCESHLQTFLGGLDEIARSTAESAAAALKRLGRELGSADESQLALRQTLDAARIHRLATQLGKNWFQEMRGENDAA